MLELYDLHWKEFVWRKRLRQGRNFPDHVQLYEDADIL